MRRSLASFVLFSLPLVLTAMSFAQSAIPQPSSMETKCLALSQLKLPNTEIASAEVVGASKFNGPPAAFSGMDARGQVQRQR